MGKNEDKEKAIVVQLKWGGGRVVQTRNRLVDSRRQFVFRLHNLVEVATWTLLAIIFWKTTLFKEFIFHAVYFFPRGFVAHLRVNL